MSLLPIYYNSNRLTPKRRKKKNVSEKELRLIQEHEKFLKRMGVGKYIPPLKTERPQKSVPPLEIEKPDVSKWEPCLVKKSKPTLDSSVIIGQAYNKGNLVVLSKSDSKDASTNDTPWEFTVLLGQPSPSSGTAALAAVPTINLRNVVER